MPLTIQPLTPAQIHQFLTWQYEGPYAMYNMSGDDVETAVSFFRDPDNGYFAIVDENDELLGFCNFGADARVPGGIYHQPALDIGIGMRPDLTGRRARRLLCRGRLRLRRSAVSGSAAARNHRRIQRARPAPLPGLWLRNRQSV